MGNIKDKSIISAISEFSSIYIKENIKEQNCIVDAINEVSGYVSNNYKSESNKVKEEIRQKLIKPLDPLALNSNFIRFSDYDYSETAWTKWLVFCFKDKYVGEMFWRAFCDAVSSSIADDSLDKNLLNEKDWGNLAAEFPTGESFDAEYPIKQGRIDIRIRFNDYLIYIENKVGAMESNGQLLKYKNHAKAEMKKRSGINKIGLVFLTEEGRENIEKDYINISYSVFAASLRGQLNNILGRINAKEIITLWPVFCTLSSIEQDILGYSIDKLKDKQISIVEFSGLQRVNSYLPKKEG